MAVYTEIFRKRSVDNTIGGSIEIGTSTSYVSVNYYTEMIIYHTLVQGFPAFRGEQYLYVTNVSSPVEIYIGVSGNNKISAGDYSNTTGALKGDAKYSITELGAGAMSISNGDKFSVKLSHFDMANNIVPKFQYTNFIDGKTPAIAQSEVEITLASRISGNGYYSIGSAQTVRNYADITEYIPLQDKSTKIISADSFTDENKKPGFTFSPFTPPGIITYPSANVMRVNMIYNDLEYYYADAQYSGYMFNYYEDISIEVGLSLDGETLVVDYRSIPMNSTAYNFSLTDAEVDKLRQFAQGSNTLPIYYMVKTTRSVVDTSNNLSKEFYSKAQRNLTIVDCQPQLNPTVIDVNSDTIALTGNPNIFVRYESMVEFSTGAVASKHATIVSQSVQCGSKVISNLYNGVIDDIESGSFIFNATDSRGLHAEQVVITNTAMINYVKPSIKQDATITLSGETGAIVKLKLSGNYYNGSFGLVDNNFKLEVRYKSGSGEMGAWQTITDAPTFNNNTYELTLTFPGLSYDKGYVFQTRLTDILNVVETAQEPITLLPLFDWSQEDFNFNIPINMNNKAVLRHNKEANNTVLSASGGHIYLRPMGTDETYGQTIIYPDGSVEFGGSVDLDSSFTIDGNSLADYIIEAGEEAMGTNGTWYWRKWASGKAECWGCRNYGRMAVTTAWGNLYRSEIFTQDLPENVFIRTPDVIDINIVNSTFGGWICKHENTAPSAITTGSFIFTRPASATNTISYIGFYIIGEWK